MSRRRAFVIIAVAVLVASGCAAPESSRDATHGRPVALTVDPTLTPLENLRRWATSEEGRSEVPTRDVAFPPGLDPHVLTPRTATDVRARLTLDEAITELARVPWRYARNQATERDTEAEGRELDSSAATAAQRHYIKGREAALEGRHYQAIAEFHRALEIDPEALPVLREIARSQLAVGNLGQSTEFYLRMAQLDPEDSEAIFSLALYAANRRDWEQAAAMLAQSHLVGRTFDHDPAARLIAQFTLANALRSLGYDLASIEAAGQASSTAASVGIDGTIYGARVMSIHRQQSELWRGIGDAHCRLEEYGEAMEAYAIAAALPSVDPASLHPRVIYTNLRLGRVYTAQVELLAVLKGQGESISDRDIRLCAYIADHVTDIVLLREEVLAMYRANEHVADLARAAAALHEPDDAAGLLGEFVERSPRDVRVVGALLTWFAGRYPHEAAELVASLIEAHPDLAGDYVSRLVFSTPRPAEIIEHARRLGATSASANMESRVLIALGALGEAWSTCAAARSRWPRDRGLLWLQLELTTLLEEPAMLRRVAEDAGAFNDAVTWMFRARAHRGLGQMEEAIEAAERAFELIGTVDEERAPLSTRILLELAVTYHAYAMSREDEFDKRQWAQEAAVVAVRVIEHAPKRETAYELLIGLHGPGGPLSDPARFQEIVQQLAEAVPDSRLYARLAAEEMLGQRRHEQALERLVNLYDSDPSDVRALGLAVEAWTRGDQLDAARVWLSDKLQERPGDPALLEQWVTVMMRKNKTDDVIKTLSEAIEREPLNFAAVRLLESAYRAMGEMDQAFHYGEKRLYAMPRGVRREIELAALYGGVGMESKSMALLEEVMTEAEDASFDQLLTAIAILSRLESDPFRRHELTAAYAEYLANRFSETPMQIYALGLGALAKLGYMDERFDSLTALAISRMPEGTPQQVAVAWRDLAQALVNAQEPAAAARALRSVIRAEHLLDVPMTGILLTMAIAADASAQPNAQHTDQTIALISELDAVGRLPVIFGMEANEPPTIVSALYAASQVHSILGSEAGVEKLLRRAIEIKPDHPMMLNNLGYMRIENGHDDAETIEWIERAHELEPEDPHILDTIGWLRYRQGMFQDEGDDRGAVSLIQAAVDAAADSVAELYEHLGDAYWRVGRDVDAVEMWARGERLLSDPEHRPTTVQNLQLVQVRGWGIAVADPEAIYERLYGKQLDRLRNKIEASRSDEEPRVAPTFLELKTAMPRAAEHEHQTHSYGRSQ